MESFGNKGENSKEDLQKKLEELAKENPLEFFRPLTFDSLKEINQEKRLELLIRACGPLEVAPKDVEDYFANFPEDLESISDDFITAQGRPTRGNDFNIWPLVYPLITDRLGKDNIMSRNLESIADITERRKLAPKFLIGETNYSKTHQKLFDEFGKAAEGFSKALDEASELSFNGTHFINTHQIFSPEFGELEDASKAEFLRNCLILLQYSLIFEETYNSVFTAESVERDNPSHLIDKDNPLFSSFLLSRYNPAHSMLFQTEQSMPVYDRDHEFFIDRMNSTTETGGYVEEYPYERLILAVLAKLRDISDPEHQNESVDLIVDFWDKNRNPIFGAWVAGALSKINPSYAGEKLLERLKQEHKNKRPFTSVLYRLELGRLGISKEGVSYLAKKYDLGVYNNPDYHAGRLTSDGDIGIFDEELKLIKYFQLSDLSGEKETIRAEVLDFTIETLFTSKADETEAEKDSRLSYLEEFKNSYYRLAQEKIFQETDVRLNNLSFREQGWFLIFYDKSDDETKEKLKQFISRFGEDGLRTFLACDYGEKLGLEILKLGENLPEEQAKEIFFRYSQLISKSQSLDNLFGEREFASEIGEAIRRRSKDLLLLSNKNSEEEEKETLGKQSILAMEGLNLLLDVLSSFTEEKESGQYEIKKITRIGQEGNSFFQVSDKEKGYIYFLKIFVRPNADEEGQARINFELEFDTNRPNNRIAKVFEQEIIYWPNDSKRKKTKRSSVLRLGIDLEDRGEQKAISLDLGRAVRQSEDLSRTGDILGNLLAQADSLNQHHTTASFTSDFSDPESFAKVVKSFKNQLDLVAA